MSSEKMSSKQPYINSSINNNMSNKKKKISKILPSKPNFLKYSKIAKMLNTFNNNSLHKKSKTSDISLFLVED